MTEKTFDPRICWTCGIDVSTAPKPFVQEGECWDCHFKAVAQDQIRANGDELRAAFIALFRSESTCPVCGTAAGRVG
jgi:hypothetical protein